jgi:hypothetical protein
MSILMHTIGFTNIIYMLVVTGWTYTAFNLTYKALVKIQ